MKKHLPLKSAMKEVVERATGCRLYRTLPHGLDFASDVVRALPGYRFELIFDVGSNVGRCARQFREQFSTARIYCFEPVKDTFGILKDNLSGIKGIECYQLAFGAAPESGSMVLDRKTTKSHLIQPQGFEPEVGPVETVEIQAVDQFCDDHRIERISFLKIDTEGSDLDVLKGAARMLTGQRIDFVQVEAGMNPQNQTHVPFETLKQYLEGFGYVLFGIYQQVHEWPTRQPNLRRTDPVFMSCRLLERLGDGE